MCVHTHILQVNKYVCFSKLARDYLRIAQIRYHIPLLILSFSYSLLISSNKHSGVNAVVYVISSSPEP